MREHRCKGFRLFASSCPLSLVQLIREDMVQRVEVLGLLPHLAPLSGVLWRQVDDAPDVLLLGVGQRVGLKLSDLPDPNIPETDSFGVGSGVQPELDFSSELLPSPRIFRPYQHLWSDHAKRIAFAARLAEILHVRLLLA